MLSTRAIAQSQFESYQLPPEKLSPWKISWFVLGILMILGGAAVGATGLLKVISLSRRASISILAGGVLGGSAAIYFQRSIYNIVVIRESSKKLAHKAEVDLEMRITRIQYSNTNLESMESSPPSSPPSSSSSSPLSSPSSLLLEERVRYLITAQNIESVREKCLSVIAQFRNSSRCVDISSTLDSSGSYIVISEFVRK